MTRSVLLIALLCAICLAPVWAQEPDGLSVMRRVDERPQSSALRQEMTVVMTDARGGERRRSLIILTEDVTDESRSLVVFTEPADVRDVGLLTIDHAGRASTQWLYMPAVGRTRRIAASAKDDSFLGTDFFFEDLEGRAPEDDSHQLLREERIDGFECWVVESTPIRDSVYSRRVSWVDQESLLMVRIEFHDRRGRLWKVLETASIAWDGAYATATQTTMQDLQRDRSTTIIADTVDHAFDPADDLFTVASLERGVR